MAWIAEEPFPQSKITVCLINPGGFLVSTTKIGHQQHRAIQKQHRIRADNRRQKRRRERIRVDDLRITYPLLCNKENTKKLIDNLRLQKQILK